MPLFPGQSALYIPDSRPSSSMSLMSCEMSRGSDLTFHMQFLWHSSTPLFYYFDSGRCFLLGFLIGDKMYRGLGWELGMPTSSRQEEVLIFFSLHF